MERKPMPTFEEGAAATTSEAGSGGVTRKLVNEMIPFLRDPRPEIRQAAAATAVAASATKEGVTLLHECGAVKWLCRISGDVGTIAKDAVSALVNISAEERVVSALEDMCKAGIVNRMMEAVCAEDCAPLLRDLCLQLLANVTRVQIGAEKLAQVGVAGGAKEGQHIRNLVKQLVAHPAEDGLPYPALTREDVHVVNRRAALRDASPEEDLFDGKSKSVAGRETLDQWQHCASVLCNASRIPEGRRALRGRDPKGALPRLLPQLSSPNPVRRWGVASCVRNCCFEESDHPWLLHDVKVVPHILLRLSDDADDYDFDEKVVMDPRVWRKEDGAAPRRREPVECIKRDLLEALLQLCATVESRQSLRKMGVYFVVRELDKAEPDGELTQVGYSLVNLLQRKEQDKQERIDYLKGLNGVSDGEGVEEQEQEQPSHGESKSNQVSEIEVMSASSGYVGTTAERTAYLREKLESESGASTGNAVDNEGEKEEELVGDQGVEAMTDMLSAFDDNDD